MSPNTNHRASLLAFAALLTTATASYAGDILRGGATADQARRSASARANSGAEAAAVARRTAQDRLARTTRVVEALRRGSNGAGIVSGVPGGLVPGGLVVATGANARWDGAGQPTQNGSTVNIVQDAAQAVLHWESFNVGRGTLLNYDQSAGGSDSGKWIAYNRIVGASTSPSQILGSIKAQGQVYVINQNGIVFGAGSQVNARTFVASTIPVNDNLVTQGLLNNRDAQFLFSALNVPGGSDGTPPFVPPAPPASGRYGDIIVQAGALLQTPTSADGNGGRVMLVGANVRNEGVISTPSGQTILAAGLQVGAQAHPQTDPSLRGLDVWIGSVGDYAGTVTNSGLIESRTGSILLAGKRIEQMGALDSSTSVNLNGRIDILASYGAVGNPNFDRTAGVTQPPFLSQFTGTVIFGEKSVTRILPDIANTKKIPGARLAQNSKIMIEGLGIQFRGGSILLAPSADVSIRAGTWPFKDTDGDGTSLDPSGNDQPGLSQQFQGGVQRFLLSGGQVHFGAGSLVDVSGSTEAFVPLANHILQVQMRGSELADSPLLRDSILRGLALVVDIRRSGVYGGREWVGTPLGDLTGLAGIIERDIAQLTARGGTIKVSAGDSIVVQSGATLDVSGGVFTNEGGRVQTSRLLRGGNLIDIHKATSDRLYDGVYSGQSTKTHEKWGVSKTFASALAPLGGYNQKEYVEGAAGGTIDLTAPSLVIAGDLVGRTVKGPRQLDSPPDPGTLSLSFRGEKQLYTSATSFVFLDHSPTPPAVRFVNGKPSVSAPEFVLAANGDPVPLPAGLRGEFAVGTNWFEEEGGGFGRLVIDNRDGDVVIPRGTRVKIPAGGSLVARAANVRIQDSIIAPGGNIEFTAYNFSPFLYAELAATGALANQPAPAPVPGRGVITVDAGVMVSAAGMMIDDRPTTPFAHVDGRVLDGGSVTLEGYSVLLAEGSLIDASGGVWARPNGKFQHGTGGDIFILAGKDPELATTIGGELVMDGVVRSYSGTKGGGLTVQANTIQIGGGGAPEGGLLVQPEFFREGGFTSYSLIGLGARDAAGTAIPGIRLVSGTVIEPVSKSWVVTPFARGRSTFSTRAFLKPQGLRPAASVSLSATGADDPFTENIIEALGIVLLEEGSMIRTDPGASVKVKGQLVSVLGSITAPGGTIDIAGAGSYPLPQGVAPSATRALPTVYIGSSARLSTAGTTVLLPDPFGRRSGIIYPGGTIRIAGNIIAEAGALLDVSGTSAVLDFHPSRLGNSLLPVVPRNAGINDTPWGRRGVALRVDSDGGLIELEGSQMLYSDATLLGRAGGPSALGGTLSISSGRYYAPGSDRTGADINLIVQQNGSGLAFGDVRSLGNIGQLLAGGGNIQALFAAGTPNPGIGYFAVNTFASGGFDSLDLGFKYFESASPIPFGGNVEFRGPVTINARGFVRVAGGGVIQSTAPVNIFAPYVAIGQEFREPLNPDDPFVPFRQFLASSGSTPQYFFAPSTGTGQLNVSARMIDVGTLSLQGIGRATLAADGGDIRGSGTLNIAGDLTLRAAQIYPTTLAEFNIFAYDHAGGPGSITIIGSGTAAPPLSAGGSLNIYASTITQGGTLRAPFGSIRLGWDGTDLDPADADLDVPLNPVAGTTATVPTAQLVSLLPGSVTSVSAIDPATGKGLLIPFGVSPDGLSWIDPRGVNVTVSGLPVRGISISGQSVVTAAGSVIDIRGGGDLLAYRWIPGTGGSVDLLGTALNAWSVGQEYEAGSLVSFGGKTWSARVAIDPSTFVNVPSPSESRYWTLVPESYAIIPGFGSNFAPFNAFNTGPNSGSLAGDPGYVANGLRLGQQIFIDNNPNLPSGSYTLLPRRYALLPGAYLVTPRTSPTGSTGIGSAAPAMREEGSLYVSGYTFNEFNRAASAPLVASRYELVPPNVVAGRASYDLYLANDFMREAARRLDVTNIQRLPRDSGYLGIHGNTALNLAGSVLSRSISGGRGSRIDVSSFADMVVIGGSGSAPAGSQVVLNAGVLGSWGAESLLIGGLRRDTPDGVAVQVRTSSLTLNNPGSTLSGPDITLASRERLTMTADSSLKAISGRTQRTDTYLIQGDGTLLRVSSDVRASFVRSGLTGSTAPLLTIGDNAQLSGRAVVIDSTYASDVSQSTSIDAYALTMGSGQISIVLEPQAGGLTGSVVNPHLVLQGSLLDQAQEATLLTLLSYRTIDIYGGGTFGNEDIETMVLQSAGIRGFNPGAGAIITAQDVLLTNPVPSTALTAAPMSTGGTLRVEANSIRLGRNAFDVSGYSEVALDGTGGILAEGEGSFTTVGDLNLIAPLITGAQGIKHSVVAGGRLNMVASPGTATIAGGLGAQLSFEGASLAADSTVSLPSGSLILRARSGDLTVSGQLRAAGSSRDFYDVTRYADAGRIELLADSGNINLAEGSLISVAAHPDGGDAGSLIVRSPGGVFDSNGSLVGAGGVGGLEGSFLLDSASIASFEELAGKLDAGDFFESRNFRVRTGDVVVSGETRVQNYTLSTDAGSITVTGQIDASGETGGTISLIASDDLILASGGELTVAAQRFSNAGKGGSVHLEAGSAVNGLPNLAAVLDLQSGSIIDLSVADFTSGSYLTPGSSAFAGQFEGTLHLRAPRSGNDILVAGLGSTLVGGSAVVVEGYRVYEPAGGVMDTALRNLIHADNTAFMAAAEAGVRSQLLGSAASSAALSPLLVVSPGVEIINRTGDLTLGQANPNGSTNPEGLSSADWDLSGFRYGSRNAPGVLTLRAQGDLVFNNTLSDGFTPITMGSSTAYADSGHSLMWLAPIQTVNTLLPTNTQSWSYRLSAGADLAAANFRAVLPAETLEALQPGRGSLLVGEFYPAVPNTATSGTAAAIGRDGQTADSIRISNNTSDRGTRFEVIRTGTGDITVSTGRDVQLRNQFATIYTAGVGLADRTRIFQAGDFSTPIVVRPPAQHPGQGGTLGAIQQPYEASYAMAGGNLDIRAARDIGRFTMFQGQLVADSSRQIPTNWLYRRGYVDPASGLFGVGGVGEAGLTAVVDPSASTTWWIDYSNFFQGFGALGGGDISLIAGSDLVNADAVIPTNARMAGINPVTGQNIAPDANLLLEHGGGDLLARAGRNVDGGNFYVERGQGRISAGGEITTNEAQSPSRGRLGTVGAAPEFLDPLTWQGVTLYGGRTQFNVTARGNVLLGPTTAAFLLPQGLNNKFWYKTQFQTIGDEAGVTVASFGGSVTHRLAVTLPGDRIALPTLLAAYRQTAAISPGSAGFYRPWLRIAESSVDSFRTPATVSLPSLSSTAFAGDVNIVGTMNLFPSPNGNLELVASGGVVGMQPSGRTTAQINGVSTPVTAWTTASINLSDANPLRAPGILTPVAFQQVINSRDLIAVRDNGADPFIAFTPLFQETGSYTGLAASIDVQANLHASPALHAGNPNPVRVYASGGDLTGLTLFSPKKVLAHAERDITDIAFYLQHVSAEDISIVSAGRDVVPYNENSVLRSLAGDIDKRNIIVDPFRETVLTDASNTRIATQALAGDIQIGGAGVLEVLAGRNLDLGTGANFVDGTGTGITSIGRSRNPFLAFEGADLIVLAGVGGISGGPALGLTGSTLNFEHLLEGGSGSPSAGTTPEHLAIEALARFFDILKQAGEEAAETGSYATGYEAAEMLFGSTRGTGSVLTRARDIRTASGGSITIAAPSGGVTMASDIFGNPLTPPGIVTEYGGGVSIFTDGNVDIGQARIFTLRGGDMTIWSSSGDIAAGSAPKTVVTAPPTRVLIDATSADIQTDLGGLATGGGIGVLAAVEGVEPGAVTLLAPEGTVDAGDAGIRATGDITIAAAAVVNADNISAGGSSVGVPAAPTVAAPNIGGLSSAASSTAATSSAANQLADQARPTPTPEEEEPSIIEVEVLGYGGGEG